MVNRVFQLHFKMSSTDRRSRTAQEIPVREEIRIGFRDGFAVFEPYRIRTDERHQCAGHDEAVIIDAVRKASCEDSCTCNIYIITFLAHRAT